LLSVLVFRGTSTGQHSMTLSILKTNPPLGTKIDGEVNIYFVSRIVEANVKTFLHE
jgi:hypothetical protein